MYSHCHVVVLRMTTPYLRIGACPIFKEISEKLNCLRFHYEKREYVVRNVYNHL
jgi:hypothetical protein